MTTACGARRARCGRGSGPGPAGACSLRAGARPEAGTRASGRSARRSPTGRRPWARAGGVPLRRRRRSRRARPGLDRLRGSAASTRDYCCHDGVEVSRMLAALLRRRGRGLRRRRLDAGNSRRRRRRATFALEGFQPAGEISEGKRDRRLLRDPAAVRQAADHLREGQRAAHGRARDVRAQRPVGDHPPPPAGRRQRRDRRRGDLQGARPLPRGRRRLPGRRGRPEELPALQLGHGRRQGDRQAAARVRAVTRRSTATRSRSRAAGPEGDHRVADDDHGDRPEGRPAEVHALLRRARARDLLPRRARWTTSTRTCARRAPRAARARSAARR